MGQQHGVCSDFYTDAGVVVRNLECGKVAHQHWGSPKNLSECIVNELNSKGLRLPTSVWRHDLPVSGLFTLNYTPPVGYVLSMPSKDSGRLGCSYAFDVENPIFGGGPCDRACQRSRLPAACANLTCPDCMARLLLDRRKAQCQASGRLSHEAHRSCCWSSIAESIQMQSAFFRRVAPRPDGTPTASTCVRDDQCRHNQVQMAWTVKDIIGAFYVDLLGTPRGVHARHTALAMMHALAHAKGTSQGGEQALLFRFGESLERGPGGELHTRRWCAPVAKA